MIEEEREPIRASRYRRKEAFVWAFRWEGDHNRLDPLREALELKETPQRLLGGRVSVYDTQSSATCRAGDWILRRENGEMFTVTDEEFRRDYEAI